MAEEKKICKFNNCKNIPEDCIDIPCCGSQICQEHLNEIFKEGQFECFSCKSKIENKNIALLKNINDIENAYDSFRSLMSDPAYFVYNYFNELKNQTDIQREELKRQIDDAYDKILKRIDLEEDLSTAKCIASSGSLEYYKNTAKKFGKDLVNVKTDFLFNKLESEDLQGVASDFLARVKKNIELSKNLILDYRRFELHKPTLKIPDNYLGSFDTLFVDFKFNIITWDDEDVTIRKLRDGTIKLICYDIKPTKSIKIYCVRALSYNKIIMSASNKQIKVWNIKKDACIKVFDMTRVVLALCVVSEKNSTFLSGNTVGLISLRNISNPKAVKEYQSCVARINKIVYVPKKEKFISISDFKVNIWDFLADVCLREIDIALRGSRIYDNSELIGCSRNKIVMINLSDYKQTELLECCALDVELLPNEKIAISEYLEPIIQVWDMAKKEFIGQIKTGNSSNKTLKLVKDDKIAVRTRDKIEIWDTKSLRCVHTINDSGHPTGIELIEI